ncbi:DivIVA domain-containing protein [Nitriliruptoraceae bacterium ZYF776]|nr:DivIVA domain-containing protein [Profundirhabdus halotolerans]
MPDPVLTVHDEERAVALTPDEITGYRFGKAVRGYAIGEVDELLDELAAHVAATDTQLEAAERRADEAELRATAALETEQTLKRTLITAQRAAERSIEEARAHAEELVETARAEAERLRADARDEADRTLDQAQQLARREVDAARARVRDAAERHAELLRQVAAHRDQLRAHLADLDALAVEPPPSVPDELVIGEVSTGTDEVASAPIDDPEVAAPPGPADDGAREHARDDASGLTVRVHTPRDPAPPPPPLGSGTHEGH